MSFVSYASNWEDVLLHRVFGGQETGFYVDVGAYHPTIGSVTKSFYDRGWSGINIEPGSVFTELAAARPRDVNLRMAVLDRAGDVAFFENEADRGMSHVVMGEIGGGTARMVPCDTLEAIVRAHSQRRPVDFVKIDVEGAEAAIVRSTDWHRLRPRVLLLEATLPWSSTLTNQDWEPVLLEQGYVRAYFDGINCFYIPEEEAPLLLRHFQAPVNVLDRVVSYDCEALRATLNEQRNEAARIAAERDALDAALHDQQNEAARIALERDALRAALNDQQNETARLTTERDALRDELNRAADAVRALEARLAPPPMAASAVVSPRNSGRGLARRATLVAYRLVRPVVRPVAWRVRGFLIGDLSQQVGRLGERIEALPASRPIQIGDIGGAAEMRRLAAEMEHALLTLAMERGPDRWPEAAPIQSEPMPPVQRVALLLPHGRTAEVEYVAGDLSVGGSLRASGGDWEPHVRRYLETVVRPDWVCLDIGANLGAHTLSLAVLAHDGRVVAFEPDATNFALLSRNAAALAPPRAVIEPVQVALWDSQGTLVSGGADELAGCCFVAEGVSDPASVEQRLRTVVDADAISGTELHVRVSEVPALPLDVWMKDSKLPRLDLIKMDVEGGEVRVLRGADATLREHRPVLVVEYNPACAETYFGEAPDALFRELAARFASISALEPDGTLTPLADWPALQTRLAAGKGWEDLVCVPGPRA